jgi:hypothetical protein
MTREPPKTSAGAPTANTVPVYLEIGGKRAFAGAVDWPGWSRSGRGEQEALEALIVYGPRYAVALGTTAGTFEPPSDRSTLDVVERLAGNATTDFGAPAIPPSTDALALEGAEAERWVALLGACWVAFDRAARDARGVVLRRGPRGGGRQLDAIVRHVVEAERGYLPRLGGTHSTPPGVADVDDVPGHRRRILDALAARGRDELPAPTGRPRTLWPPRYFIRRTAWHALDHAWEIEDRSTG